MNMATSPRVALPLTVSLNGGTLNEVVDILESALGVAAKIPQIAPEAGLGAIVLHLISAAVQRIQTETGKPIDLSNIPYEAPLPEPSPVQPLVTPAP